MKHRMNQSEGMTIAIALLPWFCLNTFWEEGLQDLFRLARFCSLSQLFIVFSWNRLSRKVNWSSCYLITRRSTWKPIGYWKVFKITTWLSLSATLFSRKIFTSVKRCLYFSSCSLIYPHCCLQSVQRDYFVLKWAPKLCCVYQSQRGQIMSISCPGRRCYWSSCLWIWKWSGLPKCSSEFRYEKTTNKFPHSAPHSLASPKSHDSWRWNCFPPNFQSKQHEKTYVVKRSRCTANRKCWPLFCFHIGSSSVSSVQK